MSDRRWRTLLYFASLLSLIAAFAHVWVMPEHFHEWWGYGMFFLVLAAAQALYGVALLNWARIPLFVTGIVGTLGVTGVYFYTRTVGVPLFGPHAGHVEEMSGVDLLSQFAQLGLVVVLLGLTLDQSRASALGGGPQARGWALAGGLDILKRPWGKMATGLVMVLILLLVGYRFGSGLTLGGKSTITASDAEECARAGCDVYFTATLATQQYAEQLGLWSDIEPRLKMARAFVLSAAAHVGTIRSLYLRDKVYLQAEGAVYPAVLRPLQYSSHHNSYLVFVPSYDMQGHPLFSEEEGRFEIIVKEVGDGLQQHRLAFDYSLSSAVNDSSPTLSRILMVLGAAMAALLLTCTPCLIGSMAVGSLTTGTTTGFQGTNTAEALRGRMVRSAIAYLAALAVAYLAIAMAVYTLGLRSEDLRPLEVVGGLVLLSVGLSMLRGTRLLTWLEEIFVRAVVKVATGLVGGGKESLLNRPLGQGGSSAMGASLAMVCSVAGAPTLSTATLLPLLVYAGLSSPIWAFIVLSVYLLVCAIPFFLLSLGLGEALMNASVKLRAGLLIANAILLVAFGLVLLFSPSAVADAVSAPVRILLLPLRWLL